MGTGTHHRRLGSTAQTIQTPLSDFRSKTLQRGQWPSQSLPGALARPAEPRARSHQLVLQQGLPRSRLCGRWLCVSRCLQRQLCTYKITFNSPNVLTLVLPVFSSPSLTRSSCRVVFACLNMTVLPPRSRLPSAPKTAQT